MLWKSTIPLPVSRIIADSIFSDLINVYLCTYNLMHGLWSLCKSKKKKKTAANEALLKAVSC